MNQPNSGADKLIDKRRMVHEVGKLRREKMIVIRVGERRAPCKNQPDQVNTATTS